MSISYAVVSVSSKLFDVVDNSGAASRKKSIGKRAVTNLMSH